jgi:RNA polymerase sigma-70 factor (ECF subfamily)
MEGEQAREQIGSGGGDLNPGWVHERSSSAPWDTAQECSWVAASRRGDNLAFNRLVLKWEQTVYNVALRMLQDRQEAEEATQEIFLSAYKNIRRFRQDAKFSTWLYRIAVNHCISRNRRRPQGIPISLDDPGQPPRTDAQLRVMGNQEENLLDGESRNRVRTALSFLPVDQRAVIELKFFQELTFEEIAAVLRVPVSTIKSRLYSGLDLLKVRLGNKA